MKTIKKYLKDPIKNGVYRLVLNLDIDKILKFAHDMVKKHRAYYAGWVTINHEIKTRELIEKECEKEGEDYAIRQIFEPLFEIEKKVYPKDVSDAFKEMFGKIDTGFVGEWTYFDSEITLFNLNDCLTNKFIKHDNDKYWLICYSLKKETLSKFVKLLENIFYENSIEKIQLRKTHRSDHVVRPYIAILKLFLKDKQAYLDSNVVADLKKAIEEYFYFKFRSTILLSGIALEEKLVEIYENHFKEQAPEKPIGALIDVLHDTKRGIHFPRYLYRSIIKSKDIRNMAVHRGKHEINKDMALDAIKGATQLKIWYDEYINKQK